MGRYNFKDKYFNYLGQDVNSMSGTKAFGSAIAPKDGTGSRTSPYRLTNGSISLNRPVFFIALGSGIYTGTWSNGQEGSSWNFYGAGIGKTIFSDFRLSTAWGTGVTKEIKDITLNGFHTTGWEGCVVYNCEILKEITSGNVNSGQVRNCLIRINAYTGSNNSYVGVGSISLKNAQNNLYDNCGVAIASQADVNASVSRYTAFNNCNFRIGAEPDFTPLAGSTAAELRQSFVDRCAAQGYTVPSITEYGETLQAGRWIFSNNSAVDGLVLKGSVIHNFEKRRLIYFGYSDFRSDKIAITTDKSRPSAFSPGYANSSIEVTDGSIALASNVDISKAVKGQACTNIIWLGGKYPLSRLDIIHNFPKTYGVFVDSSPTLSSTPVTSNGGIVPYVNGVQRTYLVRSNNDLEATITYNGANYSSSLSTRNNIFRGVDNVTSFTLVTSNAVVYEILDEVMYQTIQMRIANKIPTGNIAAGTPLVDGYWYLVEHGTDQSNTTDYVTYGGVNYPVGSSFIASGTGTFVKTGNVHLRRCWKDDFVYDTETLDKVFWANEQKPEWFDVLPDDLRCLMKNNNGNELEMQTDANGTYIASGHADFYNSVLGVAGIVKPSYPIKGTYMQLRLVVTTQNPM